MEIAAGAAAANVLMWALNLLGAGCLVCVVALAFIVWRERRKPQPINRRRSVIPDHPAPLFPPYQGL